MSLTVYLKIKNRFLSYNIKLDILAKNKYLDDTDIKYNKNYKIPKKNYKRISLIINLEKKLCF